MDCTTYQPDFGSTKGLYWATESERRVLIGASRSSDLVIVVPSWNDHRICFEVATMPHHRNRYVH